MRVLGNGALGHLHLGGALATDRSPGPRGADTFGGFSNHVGEPIALEYPTTGSGDHRVPALMVEHGDGSTVLDLAYVEHRIVAGKPQHDPAGRLPATYVESDDEADTLEIVLVDAPSGLRAELSYTIFADRAVVSRSARIHNDGPAAIRLAGAMSLSLDLPDADWDLVQLSGGWARENH